MVKLSKRLQCVAEFVTEGARVADIGSDHALLPVYLRQTGRCRSAVAGELNPGPYTAALKQVQAAGLQATVAVRRGNGLDVIEAADETDTVIIAGMGGVLISEILEAGRVKGKLANVYKLILQPNVGEFAVRRWLVAHNWLLKAETILEEDGKIYEIIQAVREVGVSEAGMNDSGSTGVDNGTDADNKTADAHNGMRDGDPDTAQNGNRSLYDTGLIFDECGIQVTQELLYSLGPLLIRNPNEVWRKKWQLELDKLEHICQQLAQSGQQESREKESTLRQEMNKIKEVLACSHRDKPSSS
ncbi:tRNA (adenine-N(1))-methyltransferase [Paenibacillaceae bacterium]|nr:tRNA (adenine-N(1))-methyltransferase [Paenibacillaceae bacterium]